ncbi:MAG: PQQ-binding-like beta-propeller repeat protein [Planctomycetota bacterium JB042]
MSFQLAALALAVTVATADDWPEYRGPRGDGRTPVRDLPLTWSEDENVTWKVPIAGRGWSTPAIGGGRIWLTTSLDDGRRRLAVCLDRETGRTIHAFTLFHVRRPEPCHGLNSYASPSPVLRGGRVFVHFGGVGTACLDARTAREIWVRRDLPLEHVVGSASSPILVGDHLIFHQDGANRQYVIALDAGTGETRWVAPRSPRLFDRHREHRKAFSTPLRVDGRDGTSLVSVGAGATVGLDPSDGRELWRVLHDGYSGASRPVAALGLTIFSTGFDVADLVAVRIADAREIWRYERNVPWITSPVVVGDLLFMVSYPGIATCLEVRTGERVWRRRLGGEFCASPLAASGRAYLFDREGTCTVVAADRDGSILAENRLDEGMMASPAVADGALFLRTTGHLYRIDAPR